MSGEPLVSIIIPNYNYGRFLAEAVESALRQTHPRIEVIVVDDGSTDDSHQVIESFSSRIRSVSKENGGLSSARNAGIRMARGDMLLFLDSDDILFPDAVEGLIKGHGVCGGNSLVYGDSVFFNATTAWAAKRKTPSGRIWRQLIRDNFICCHEVLVPRRLAQLGFDESLRMSEDFDLWLRLAREYPYHHVPVTVARRRIHGGMMSKLAEELQFWTNQVLKKQRTLRLNWGERLALAGGLGRNLHFRAYLAKERRDYFAMRRMSLGSVRWQPWRPKNWLYLGFSLLAGCKRSASGE